MTAPQIVVTMGAVSTEPEQIARAIEAMGRAAAGLALEGMTAQITAATVPDGEETE